MYGHWVHQVGKRKILCVSGTVFTKYAEQHTATIVQMICVFFCYCLTLKFPSHLMDFFTLNIYFWVENGSLQYSIGFWWNYFADFYKFFFLKGNFRELIEYLNGTSDLLAKNGNILDNVLETLDVQQHSLGVLYVLVAKFTNLTVSLMQFS